MGRGLHQLNARKVDTLKDPGLYNDGGGLYLFVRQRAERIERLWLYRTRKGGQETKISLGPVATFKLAEARQRAELCRKAVTSGRCPRVALRALADPSGGPTFGEVADQLIDTLCKGFKNDKHKKQWRMTLGDTYCATLRSVPIADINERHVLDVLEPIWLTKPETASRIRGRIERVLDSARVHKLRDGDNPARWRGHLQHVLPKQSKLGRGHHRALAWSDAPAFINRLRARDSMSALALEWTILTAARTQETVLARTDEIDDQRRIWTIPAERMKMGRAHRVPLCDRALAIVAEVKDLPSPYLFVNANSNGPLSLSAMAECLKDMNTDATVHGFRSTFRDWAGDATAFPREVAEAALAHVVGDATEQAYRREDALEKRRALMDAWSAFLSQDSQH